MTSNPEMPGSPMSKMIRPKGSLSARNSAVSPSLAPSAACPAALSSAKMPRASAASSSTRRIRAMSAGEPLAFGHQTLEQRRYSEPLSAGGGAVFAQLLERRAESHLVFRPEHRPAAIGGESVPV